jgi:class 3 adenylate cyclase/pimeloyl-ACP methyl ester carboxylesterase
VNPLEAPPAETRYARGEEGYVAYQAFGSGPPDLLFITNWMTNVDVMWEEPGLASYLRRLASFSRVICYDKRGSGVSDPVPLAALPTMEQWVDDARAALDAAGVERAALLGDTEGGPMAMVFAATHPERVSALVLINSFARFLRDDDYPIGMPLKTWSKLVDRYEQHWGSTAEILDLTAPSAASDGAFRRWFTRYQRLAMSKGSAATQYRWITRLDVRSVLPSIYVPTLVIGRSGARHHRPEFGRYLAQRIPGARYVELPGCDTYPFQAGNPAPVLDQVEEFLTGARPTAVTRDRVLATVLMTDIVDSTGRAAALGDAAWRELRGAHDRVVREHLARFRGREIDHAGDGFLATFDGPARAVGCAARLVQALRGLDLSIRAGIHTGEVEVAGSGITGLAVHIAARVMARADAGRTLVSGTVRDLVAGSGIGFAERGAHDLRGIPGRWQLFEVTDLP